jgi:hypothetical protein
MTAFAFGFRRFLAGGLAGRPRISLTSSLASFQKGPTIWGGEISYTCSCACSYKLFACIRAEPVLLNCYSRAVALCIYRHITADTFFDRLYLDALMLPGSQ